MILGVIDTTFLHVSGGFQRKRYWFAIFFYELVQNNADLLLLDVVIKDQKQSKYNQSGNRNKEVQLALGVKDPANLLIFFNDAI